MQETPGATSEEAGEGQDADHAGDDSMSPDTEQILWQLLVGEARRHREDA